MLLAKDTNKISELKTSFTHRWLEPDYLLNSLECFSFSSLCKCFGAIKVKGYSFQAVFSILVSIPFLGQATVYGLLRSPLAQYIELKKDVFYWLKNKPSVSWREILSLFALKFIKTVEEKGDKRGTKQLRQGALLLMTVYWPRVGGLLKRYPGYGTMSVAVMFWGISFWP